MDTLAHQALLYLLEVRCGLQSLGRICKVMDSNLSNRSIVWTALPHTWTRGALSQPWLAFRISVDNKPQLWLS